MDIFGRILDRTVGRLIDAIAGRWARGATRNDRQRETLRGILATMGEAIAEADKLGKGYVNDAKYMTLLAEAEGRLGTVMGEIHDEDLIGIGREFLASCRVIAGDRREAEWSSHKHGLRTIRDRAADRVRVLQAKL